MISSVHAWLASAAIAVQAAPYTSAPSSPPPATSAAALRFNGGIIGSRDGDPRTYVLLGSGFLRPLTAPGLEQFVGRWLAAHPGARVVTISRDLSTNTRTHQQMEIAYVWLEDGSDSLNVDLVAAGMVVGATMNDMIDNQRGLDALLQNPKLADVRADIARERAAAPQDRVERMIPDKDYAGRLERIRKAERRARSGKLGIWSAAMKAEREAEGIR